MKKLTTLLFLIIGSSLNAAEKPNIIFIMSDDQGYGDASPFVIHHSISGRFAIRKGDWKFIAAQGSGGWSKGDDGKPSQLYDMASDRKEENNLATPQPDISSDPVAEFISLKRIKYCQKGRLPLP